MHLYQRQISNLNVFKGESNMRKQLGQIDPVLLVLVVIALFTALTGGSCPFPTP